MSEAETNVVLFEEQGDWVTLWLNRPEARNALSDEMVAQITEKLAQIAARKEVRGITMRGKGAVFCAGGDLKGFKNNFQESRDEAEVIADSSKIGKVFLQIKNMPQVTVFLLHGAAMAGGLGMACAADLVIGVKNTRMALTETTIGVVPAQILPHVVNRVGEFNARRIMLTGLRFTALEGADFGIVDFLADDMAEAESQLAELQAGVRRCAPSANAATKKLLQRNKELAGDAMIAEAGKFFAQSVKSDEGREGVASFLEKRKPSWAQK